MISRPIATAFRTITVLLVVLVLSLAAAQHCTLELEPNDTPATATVLSGEGRDAVGAQESGQVGIVCLSGEMLGNDQDAYVWVVDEASAAQSWRIEIEGPAGGLTQIDLVDVEFADNGSDVVSADTLYRFGTTDGRRAVSREFLVAPGRIVLGLSKAGTEGEYLVNLVPTPLRSGSSTYSAGRRLDAPVAVMAPLTAEVAVPFTISEDGSSFVWGLSLHAPLGSRPSLTLTGPSGEVAELEAGGVDPARLSNLGLAAGEYTATLTPGSAAESGFVRLAVESQGRVGDGTEVEPNDNWETATRLPLGTQVSGTAENWDYYRIDVAAEQAGSTWDLVLEAEAELTLYLNRADGSRLQQRVGVSGSSRGLTLTEGAYQLVVRGGGQAAYTISLTSAEAPADGFEREPNDTVAGATPLGESAQARGELALTDEDYFALEVVGEAQRFRVQAVGNGVARLDLYNTAGQLQDEVRGAGRLRLDDLVLIPGTHYFRITGAEGEYAVRALSLGPAPAPEPPADAPRHDEPLTVAVRSPEPEGSPEPGGSPEPEQPMDAALDDPPAAALPQLPPPPPGLLESEPNGDASRSQRIFLDAVHVGRLPDANDEDFYRFYLANDQYVRIELLPDVPDSGWALRLDGSYVHPLDSNADGSLTLERWLLAGDHRLDLRGSYLETPSSGYYQLRVTPLGTLGLPVDLEPNNSVQSASLIPSDLRWAGRVGLTEGDDYYLMPRFERGSLLRLLAEAESGVDFEVVGDGLRSQFEESEQGLELTLPAGVQTYLRVRGSGAYEVALSFTEPLPADARLRPALGEGLALSLDLETTEATAFWHEGQRIAGTLSVTNSLEQPTTVELLSGASDAGVRIEAPARVEVGAGTTVAVPVVVELPTDMREDLPVVVQLQGVGNGASAVADARVSLRCVAPPVGAFSYWPLPDSLLGRPNVLFAGFGTTLAEGIEPNGRFDSLIDGRTAVSTGGIIDARRTPTFRFGTNGPVTLIGTVLNPQSDTSAPQQLRRFVIETSLDGVSFEPAFEGELSAVNRDQAFVFAEPVVARYARLLAIDAQNGRADGYLGEWKLIAEDAALFSGVDLALPALGGHAAWSRPHVSRPPGFLAGSSGGTRLDLRVVDGFEFVIGFNHGRAALIDGLSWRQPDQDELELFDQVEVSLSTTGAAGPWTVVGQWPLTRAAGALTAIALDEQQWARYVKFSAPRPSDAERYAFTPAKVAIIEAAVAEQDGGPAYRSALSAWGTNSKPGPYEWLNGVSEAANNDVADAGDTPEQATPLTGGELATGTVAVAEDVDWYGVTVPEGQNHFELRLTGDPSIAYRYGLYGPDDEPLDVEVHEDGVDVVLSGFVDPGSYLLKLEEPKRTVIFSWDTSGSVAPYTPITYASLAAFARGVDGEREAVQLLAYDSPTPEWLLPNWSHDTERVQRALSEFDRNADSSNSEIALLTATKALAGRGGTTAILLITDAESGGDPLSPELWEALEGVRPRVFTFEISSGGSDYSQDLMQDWAAVNAGYYELADGVSSFEAGFDRASCLMRRPKRYSVQVETAFVPPPGPGTLSVTQAPGATQGAVEVIFDASGSMGQKLPSGEQRIVAAKRALETLVADVLPDETPFALRAFGHITPSSCETRLDVPLGVLDREKALSAVRAIEPKLLSQTAIADSLSLAADDLAAAAGARTVILITDGEESCGGDPAAAAQALRESGSVALAIVSLALDADALATFESLAQQIDASYIDVTSYEALAAAITEALVPAFEVYDFGGELVATGRVGDSVELPMGTYRVRVLSEPIEVFESVRVPGDGSVGVTAGAP